MSRETNYGKPLDPPIQDNYNDIEEWEMEQIILFGELTTQGEQMYELTRERCYDEKQDKWITI